MVYFILNPDAAEIRILPGGADALMTEAEARQVVDQIRGCLDEARRLIYDLHRREGWKALGYSSWRECVVAEFEQSQRTLYYQLEAAQIEAEVLHHGAIGSIPERQLRPLSPLRDEPEQLREAWSIANERADGQPTGRDVQAAVDEVIARGREDIPGQGTFGFGGRDDRPAPVAPTWSKSERDRRRLVEQGETVLANQRADLALIAWAQAEGLFIRIDRATAWGNPYILGEDGDRAAVIESFRIYFRRKIGLQGRGGEIRGKVLGCWCYPERCHGNIIIEELG